MFGEKRVTVQFTQHVSLNNKDNLALIILTLDIKRLDGFFQRTSHKIQKSGGGFKSLIMILFCVSALTNGAASSSAASANRLDTAAMSAGNGDHHVSCSAAVTSINTAVTSINNMYCSNLYKYCCREEDELRHRLECELTRHKRRSWPHRACLITRACLKVRSSSSSVS